MKSLSTALALVVALGSVSAMAANADRPYSNIDRRVDKGNDTGNSQVEILNQQQLDAARGQNTQGSGPGAPPAPAYPGAVR